MLCRGPDGRACGGVVAATSLADTLPVLLLLLHFAVLFAPTRAIDGSTAVAFLRRAAQPLRTCQEDREVFVPGPPGRLVLRCAPGIGPNLCDFESRGKARNQPCASDRRRGACSLFPGCVVMRMHQQHLPRHRRPGPRMPGWADARVAGFSASSPSAALVRLVRPNPWITFDLSTRGVAVPQFSLVLTAQLAFRDTWLAGLNLFPTML